MLKLVLIKSPTPVPRVGTKYNIEGSSPVTLGRGSKADMCLKSPDLSREHLQFVPTSTGWFIKDLGGKNGSHLNGTKLEALEPLQTGDNIRAGKFFFRVVDISAPSDSPKQINFTTQVDEEDPPATKYFDEELYAEFEDLL